MTDSTQSLINSTEVLIPVIKDLSELSLPGNIPNIQFVCQSIDIETRKDELYFSAKGEFESCFGQEMEQIHFLESMTVSGQRYVHMLYTFRSVSRAIPMISIVTPADASKEIQESYDIRREELNKKIIEILRPEILKLKELMVFVRDFVRIFCDFFRFLTSPEALVKIIPESVYEALIKSIDLIVKLDHLKDQKASVNNDFTRYKRSLMLQTQVAKRTTAPSGSSNSSANSDMLLDESTQLQLFLSNPDPRKAKHYIYLTLQEELKKINGYDHILVDIIEHSLEYMEKSLFVTPDDKHRTVRILPYLMLLLDGSSEDPKSINVFKAKSIVSGRTDIERRYEEIIPTLQSIFIKYPVVPLFADMTVTAHFVFSRSPHFDSIVMGPLWGCTQHNPRVVQDHTVTTHWASIKHDYDTYMTRLTTILRDIDKPVPFSKVLDDATLARAQVVYEVTKEGILFLSQWNGMISRAISWKLTHPVYEKDLESLGVRTDSLGIEYQAAIKYNFSKSELTVLVEIVTMIKSLANILGKTKAKLAPLLRLFVHHSVQQLVQGDLLPVLHRADKRKKETFTGLMRIRMIAADWIAGEPQDDYKQYSRKQGGVTAKHPVRVVGPSFAQLQLLRADIRALYDERSAARKKSSFFFGKSDLEKDDIVILERFYYDSFYFSYVLELSSTLRSVSDLSDLWYRELFLDVTKCVQFPIDMSLPWILCEHVISSQSGTLPILESAFFIIDIYNDAAHRALFELNQQYLYDEVESETNLVFEQFAFILSDEIYAHFKNMAAWVALDQSYKEQLQLSGTKIAVEKRRYEIPMLQRHLQLLGRSIDLNYSIGQHVNNKIIQDAELALKRFESSDITGIIELNAALSVIRETHSLLSEHLELDPFENIFSEINESYSPGSYRSVINTHVVKSLVNDLFPNFCYNMFTGRFTRAPIVLKPVTFAKPPRQLSPNLGFGLLCGKAFENYFKEVNGFCGRQHLESLFRISAAYFDLPFILEMCLHLFTDRLNDLQEYIEALKDGIPPCKPPKAMFRSGGCFGYYEGILRPLLDYDDLKKEVFQIFREIGNTIAFFKMMSEIMAVTDNFMFSAVAPFLGITPSSLSGSADQTPVGNILGHLSQRIQRFQAENLVVSVPTMNQISELNNRLVKSLSKSSQYNTCIFRHAVQKIQLLLQDLNKNQDWSGRDPVNGVIDVERAHGFHHLWSALSFLFCVNDTSGGYASSMLQYDKSGSGIAPAVIADEDEFGHGFTIGGVLLIYLLDQKRQFLLLDYSHHVLNVFSHDLNSTSASTVGAVDEQLQTATDNFILNASLQRSLQNELFNMFSCVYEIAHVDTKSSLAIFHPPSND